MPMEAFDQICPDIARAELRVCEVKEPGLGVPMDSYVLREFYCTDSGCDCRRVLVQMMPLNGPAQVAVSVNYGWEKAKYYRKWSRDPELWREMAGATLEPFAEQGPHARQFLKVFQRIIQDRALVAAFRRHYRLTKEKVDSAPDLPDLSNP